MVIRWVMNACSKSPVESAFISSDLPIYSPAMAVRNLLSYYPTLKILMQNGWQN